MNETKPRHNTDRDQPDTDTDTIPGMTARQSTRNTVDFPDPLQPVGIHDCYTMVMYLPKGGAGKSTTAAAIARETAAKGHKTLLIGLSAKQTEATDQLGVTYRNWDDDEFPNVATIFNRDTRSGVVNIVGGKDEFVDALIYEGRGGVDVIPEHEHLDGLENSLPSTYPNAADRYSILSEFLTDFGLRERYDVIIFDAPGTPGEIVNNAIWAAQNVVVPVIQGGFEKGQVKALLYELQDIRKHGRDIRVISIQPNQFNPDTTQGHGQLLHYQRHYGDLIAPGVIPHSQAIEDAQDDGMAPQDIEEPSNTAKRALGAYPILADDLLARIELATYYSEAEPGDVDPEMEDER